MVMKWNESLQKQETFSGGMGGGVGGSVGDAFHAAAPFLHIRKHCLPERINCLLNRAVSELWHTYTGRTSQQGVDAPLQAAISEI